LEGVNPLLKWMIKKWVARPAYHGIFAKARVNVMGDSREGYGNFESMAFRNPPRH